MSKSPSSDPTMATMSSASFSSQPQSPDRRRSSSQEPYYRRPSDTRPSQLPKPEPDCYRPIRPPSQTRYSRSSQSPYRQHPRPNPDHYRPSHTSSYPRPHEHPRTAPDCYRPYYQSQRNPGYACSLHAHQPILVTFIVSYYDGQGAYPVTPSIQYVVDCLSGLLQTEMGQNLFVPSVLDYPSHWPLLYREEIEHKRRKLRTLLHGKTICLNASAMDSLDQYGETVCVDLRKPPRLRINEKLLDAVAAHREINETNAHLFAALLSACGHELADYIRMLNGLDTTPPTISRSKPYLKRPGDRLTCGGAGYVWEESLWGGVFVLVQKHSPRVDYAESEGCAIESKIVWTVEKYGRKKGLPLNTSLLSDSGLGDVIRLMDKLRRASTNLPLPLFKPGELPALSDTRFSSYQRFRTLEKENYCVPPGLVVMRHPYNTVQIDGEYYVT